MQFNEEDQKFILEAKRDLNSFQLAKILGVTEEEVISFIKPNKQESIIKRMKPYNKNQDLKILVNEDFLKDKIKNGFSQIETAEQLGLRQQQLIWILKTNKLSWNKLKKEAFLELDEKVLYCKCSKCQITKHNTQFYPDKRSKTGFTSWCRDCNKEWCKERYIKSKEKQN